MTDEIKDGEGTTDDKPEVKLTEDETRAISLGWKPKEEWQGDPNDWVPAKWWLRYGDVEQKATALEQENKHKERVLKSMKDHYTRVKEDSIREVLDIVKRQKRVAVQNEDFQKVAELDAQADMLEAGLKGKFAQTDKMVEQAEVPQGPPPEFYAWNRENSWYTINGGDEMSTKADALAIGYVQTNPKLSYQEVLQKVTNDIKKLFPDKFKKEEPPVTGVDDGGGREASRTTQSKENDYKLTPAEKEAADRFGMSYKDYAAELKAYDKKKGRG